VNATLQAGLAAHYGGDYAFALALVAGVVAVTVIILTALGSEARGVKFGTAEVPGAGAAVGSAA
jgi:MFS transporter, SHS family, lactate transporter